MQTSNLYDFVVIGGGPAGSTISTILSRKGYKVIVLEKEHFPRRHVGESMLSSSFTIFKDLGVLDEMKKRYVRKPGVVFSSSDGNDYTNWCFRDVISDESWLSFHVERADFDKLLLDTSKKNEVQVWEGAKVMHVDLESNPNEVEVKGAKDSIEFVVRGKYVIDASGQQCVLANKMKSKQPYTHLGNRVALYGHWIDADLDHSLAEGNLKIVHLKIDGGGWMWMVPIGENKLSIGTVVDASFYNNRRKILQKEKGKLWYEYLYREIIQSSSFAANVIMKASQSNTVAISSDYSYKNTNKFGSNYATIGDASAFVDPIFASGVYLAMKSACLLADALDTNMQNQGDNPIQEVYDRIDGAYEVVEQLILNYYSEDAIKFNRIDQYFDESFEKNRTAIQIFHLLISGQFFDAPSKFLDTIALLRNEKMLAKYKNLIGYKNKDITNRVCQQDEIPASIVE